MTTDWNVVCFSEAVSPITHMSGTAGNEAIIAREAIVTPRGKLGVPYLSGNAIRHRMVREPGARWLIEEYGLIGRLSLAQLNFLFHGGNLTEGGGRENTARIAEFQRLFPLGRLIGGTLPDQILAGSLVVWRGSLVCEENRGYLEAVLPAPFPGALPSRLRPAESFVTGYQYTRGDAAKSSAGLASRESLTAGEASSNLMIFAGQSVARGAAFLHGFTIEHGSILELGALLWSLSLWQAAGGTIGGQASRGHGRLKLAILGSLAQDEAVASYLDHARSVRDEAVQWLTDVFTPRPTPNASRGRGRSAQNAGGESALLGDATNE